jgi:hypothetical protein
MIKKILGLAGLLLGASVLLVYEAAAQDYTAQPSKQSIQQYGPFTNTTATTSAPGGSPGSGKDHTCGNPAGECLFYGGDFNTNPLLSPFLPNGLANENDLVDSGTPYAAAVWVPFTVPEGRGWQVTALFSNNLASYGVLDQTPNTPVSAAFYSINSGVSAGNPGTVIDAGIAAATSTPTGRSDFGLTEYTIQVSVPSFELAPGTYWMAVVPLCTNTANAQCDGVFYLSDVEYVNVLPDGVGPAEPVDDSFFDSPLFGISFGPAYGPTGACGGEGCDSFSAGVIGTEISGGGGRK